MNTRRPRILIVLPYAMMARNFIQGGTLERLAQMRSVEVAIVSPSARDEEHARRLGMRWEPIFHPLRWPGRAARLTRALWYIRYLAGVAWRMCLVHRFNMIEGFRGFAIRLRQSWRLRMRFVAEALPMSALFGFPFPRSLRIYERLHGWYWSAWQRCGPVDALFREFRPAVMVLGHLQTSAIAPYVLAARAFQVPVLGINGSWDQPTTKGPLCPWLERIVAQNEQVREELRRHHRVEASRVVVAGWPQMDVYAGQAVAGGCSAMLARYGYPDGERLIVFAANPARLGLKEPQIARWIADRIAAGRYGARLCLHLRCHPNDDRWRERFAPLAGHSAVRLEPPQPEGLRELAELLRHAQVVLASAGSINLDAVALDTPTIGLALEDESVPYWDRQARQYEFEHLAALLQYDGLPLARSFEELDELIIEALAEPLRRAPGRRAIRDRFLGPLDGKASLRVASEILAMAESACTSSG